MNSINIGMNCVICNEIITPSNLQDTKQPLCSLGCIDTHKKSEFMKKSS